MSEGESSPEFKAIQAKPPFFKYLAQTWQRLPFSAYLAWYQVFTANARTKVGLGWVVLRPLLNAGVYGLIFGLLLGGQRPENYISFLITGVFLFEFFSATLKGGAEINHREREFDQDDLVPTLGPSGFNGYPRADQHLLRPFGVGSDSANHS